MVGGKTVVNVTFFVPAYNCADTLEESIASIMDENFLNGDEVIIVDDASTDGTAKLASALAQKYSALSVLHHSRNKGGGAARNTAIEAAKNTLLFCLDSDNILERNSIGPLRQFLLGSAADAAAFHRLHYFTDSKEHVTHRWEFTEGLVTLADYLAGPVVPGASGNYMFTRDSWLRAGGYPEFVGALDTWGFGLRQVATGQKMVVMPDSYYYHRHGHESYWVRDARGGGLSLTALQILIPFLDQIVDDDVDYIMSRKGRHTWFNALAQRPLRVKGRGQGSAGSVEHLGGLARVRAQARGVLRHIRSVVR
jgi:glycosyltransferase involved in cell wall biosynthesis